jgi:Mg2+ and Co2+ transporter CorA
MGVLYFETINKIRFLESRAYELDNIMQEVRSDIDVAIEKYGRIIDYENTNNSSKLNDIMAFFTLFSISCLPASIIGGLFGMNVRVPFQSDDKSSIKPFLVIVCSIVFTTFALFMFFKYALIRKQ